MVGDEPETVSPVVLGRPLVEDIPVLPPDLEDSDGIEPLLPELATVMLWPVIVVVRVDVMPELMVSSVLVAANTVIVIVSSEHDKLPV